MSYHYKYSEKFPLPLSEAETIHYFQLARNGDQNSKEKLIIHNLRLVAHIVKNQFWNLLNNSCTWDENDLINIGKIGLIKAINTFDIDRNTHFATYATKCIENEILMSIRNDKKYDTYVHLDEVIRKEKDGCVLTQADTLSTDEYIEENYEKKELYQEIRKSFHILDEREKQVIQMRYGFICEPMTQKLVSKKLGISESLVKRIEKRAKEKITKYLIERNYDIKKKMTEEMCTTKNMSNIEKSIYYARKIIDENMTFEKLSVRCNVDVLAIRRCLSKYLKIADPFLYEKLTNFLNKRNEIQKQLKLEEEMKAKELRDEFRDRKNFKIQNEGSCELDKLSEYIGDEERTMILK